MLAVGKEIQLFSNGSIVSGIIKGFNIDGTLQVSIGGKTYRVYRECIY